MAKYMFQVSYTAEGAAGVLERGGSARKAVVEKVASSVGGTVECFYFAFGGDDAYVIADLPDHESAAAVSLTTGASGAVQIRTIVLLTPEQLDAAAKKRVDYAPPGG